MEILSAAVSFLSFSPSFFILSSFSSLLLFLSFFLNFAARDEPRQACKCERFAWLFVVER